MQTRATQSRTPATGEHPFEKAATLHAANWGVRCQPNRLEFYKPAKNVKCLSREQSIKVEHRFECPDGPLTVIKRRI